MENGAKERSIRKVKARLFFQVNLKPSDEISVYSAYSTLEPIYRNQHYHRQSKKVTFSLYPSRLVLKQHSWFNHETRKILYISHVLKFFVFKSMKNFLILTIEMDSFSRYLLVLKISSMENIIKVCNTIESQHGGLPGGILRENIYEANNGPLVREELTENHAVVVVDNHEPRRVTENRSVQTDAPVTIGEYNTKSTVRPLERTIPKQEPLKRIIVKHEPIERSTIQNGPKWQEDVKFISYSSRCGNFVDDGGSVYMYTAQQICPNNNYYDDDGEEGFERANSFDSSVRDYEGLRRYRPSRV